MGIIVEKEKTHSELDERIRADLRRKASENSNNEILDFTENSAYSKDSKKTSRFGWIWFILILLAAISLVVILLS